MLSCSCRARARRPPGEKLAAFPAKSCQHHSPARAALRRARPRAIFARRIILPSRSARAGLTRPLAFSRQTQQPPQMAEKSEIQKGSLLVPSPKSPLDWEEAHDEDMQYSR